MWTPGAIAGTAAERVRFHWRPIVAFTATVAAGVVLVLVLGSAGVIDLAFMGRNWGLLRDPMILSLGLTTVAFVIGLLLAIPMGALRAHGRKRTGSLGRRRAGGRLPRVARRGAFLFGLGGATGYVEGLRGTPFYVQMWIVYYIAIFSWPRFTYVYLLAGLLALTLNTIAYQAEVFRAGFQSVGQGQVDAARAIGMRNLQVFRSVTFPQGLRLVTLPLVNEWISLFKVSSVLSFITIQELTFEANHLGSNLGHPIEAFLMVAIVYLAITIPLSRVTSYVERKRRIPGLGMPAPVARRRRPALG
jgi:polar amino acid transport system permease protein